MKKNALLLFFICFHLLSQAKDIKTSNSNDVEEFSTTSLMYLDIGDTRAAKEFAQTAVDKSKLLPTGFERIQANAYACLGLSFLRQGNNAIPGIENNLNIAKNYYSKNLNFIGNNVLLNLIDIELQNLSYSLPSKKQRMKNEIINLVENIRLNEKNDFNLENIRHLSFINLFSSNLINDNSIDNYFRKFSDLCYENANYLKPSSEFSALTLGISGIKYYKSYLATISEPRNKDGFRDFLNIANDRLKESLSYYNKHTDKVNITIKSSLIASNPIFIASSCIRPIDLAMNDVNAIINNRGLQLSFPPDKYTYASIEIGSSGVKYVIFRINHDKEGRLAPKEIQSVIAEKIEDGSINTDFVSFTEPNTLATANQVSAYYNEIVNKFKIPQNQIFIAISSGVIRKADNKIENNAQITNLKKQISNKIDYSGNIYLLQDSEEPMLTLLGLIPMHVRGGIQNPKTYDPDKDFIFDCALIDIGGGNTKGGKFDYDIRRKSSNFNFFSSKWGITSMKDTLKKIGVSPNQPSYIQKASEIAKGIIDTELSSAVNAASIKERNTIILNGGIFWLITSITKPEKYFVSDSTQQQHLIEIDINDVLFVKKELQNNYDKITNSIYLDGLLSKMPSNDNKAMSIAKLGIKEALTTMKEDGSKVGIVLVEELFKEISKSSISKKFYFARNGNIGWPFGLALMNIGGILDSFLKDRKD